MIWLTDIFVYKYLDQHNSNNLSIKNPSKKLLQDTAINKSHFKILIKQQKSSRLLFLQDITGYLLKLFALHMSILNDANDSSVLPSKGL